MSPESQEVSIRDRLLVVIGSDGCVRETRKVTGIDPEYRVLREAVMGINEKFAEDPTVRILVIGADDLGSARWAYPELFSSAPRLATETETMASASELARRQELRARLQVLKQARAAGEEDAFWKALLQAEKASASKR